MESAQRPNEKDDGNRNADQPEENWTHDALPGLSGRFCRPLQRGRQIAERELARIFRLFKIEQLAQKSSGVLAPFVLAAALIA
jgi:hypothetical protein